MNKDLIRLFIYNPGLESQPDNERRPVARDHKGKWWAAPWSRGRAIPKSQTPTLMTYTNKTRFKLKDRIRIRKESFGGLLFDPYNGLYYEVDNRILPLLCLLKATGLKVDEMIDSTSHLTDNINVKDFLNKLIELSLIEIV